MHGSPPHLAPARTSTCRSGAVREFSLCFGHGRCCFLLSLAVQRSLLPCWQTMHLCPFMLKAFPQVSLCSSSGAPCCVHTGTSCSRVSAAAQPRLGRILRCPLHLLPPIIPPSTFCLRPWPSTPSLVLGWKEIAIGNFFYPLHSPPLPLQRHALVFPSRRKNSRTSSLSSRPHQKTSNQLQHALLYHVYVTTIITRSARVPTG